MKKEMRRMEIEPAEGGGHMVTHHYKEMQRNGKHGIQTSYVEPERHVFGADEAHDMLAHVANHLAIDEKENDNETNQPEAGEGEDMPQLPKASARGRMSKESAERVRGKVA